MRRIVFVVLFVALACSRETPAPPAEVTTTTAAPPPAATATQVPQLDKGTYDQSLLWFRSTQKFHFVLKDGTLQAEGDLTRSTPGLEKVQVRANGEEWLAEATVKGVTWKRRTGGNWSESAPPEYANRLYQRVTVAFDPKKKEGVPMLVSSEGASNLYRFTNANSGEVHEVTVRKSDGAVERIRIGEGVEMVITP